jgi:hypothetical protein
VRSAGTTRPTILQWLRYCFGAGLPDHLDDWVLRDVTGRTWALRQLERALVPLAPLIAAILLFVPGPFWIRGVMVVAGTLIGLLFSLAGMAETTDRRLVKAGYAPGDADRIRSRNAVQAQHDSSARRRAKIAARRAQ